MSEIVDLCVIGAGPAGALAACEAAREGATVRLIGAPTGAARAESMTSAGARLLATLGLGDVLAGALLARVDRLDLDWRAEPETREMGGVGPLLVARPRLERLMTEAAVAHGTCHDAARRARTVVSPGIVTLDDGEAVRARVVIDAAGRRAPFRARPRALMPPLAAIGFRGKAADRRSRMALRAEADGWVWTAFQPGGRVDGVWAGEPAALGGLGEAGRRRLLSARCGALDPVPAFVADAGLAASPSALEGNVLRVGDAALARDPISSHGLAWALSSAARGVAAALTIVELSGEADAARDFLLRDHADAIHQATVACEAAYAEQARHATGFWTARTRKPPKMDAPSPGSPPSVARLSLSANVRLVRAAVLEEGRIRWRDALCLPGRDRPAAYIGGCPATTVLAALKDRGAPEALARRLDPHLPPRRAEAVIDMLWRAGALEHEIVPAADSTERQQASSVISGQQERFRHR